MRFHILGLGPIGSLLSHHLRRVLPQTHTITLIHKTQSQAQKAIDNGGVIRVENHGLVVPALGFESEIFESSYPNMVSKIFPTKDGRSNHGPESRITEERTRRSQGEESEMIESLFITTKAHQTLPAIRRLLPRLSGNSTIVLLQNGLGIYEQLVHEVFRNPEQRPHFFLASNTHGAWLKSFYHVVHAGAGEIEFGIIPDPKGRDFEAALLNESLPISERRPRLEDISNPSCDSPLSPYRSLWHTVAALCSLEALNTSWKPIAQVQVAMRRKLVVNAVINPLTAIMGCRNGEIFSTNAAQRIMQRVCQEAADVYAAQIQADTQVWLENLSAQDTNTSKVPVGRVPRALTRSSLEEECLRVALVTSGNISSMLSDVRKGKRTEIEFMNGYLLNLGSTYRIPMPVTATLLNLVKMRNFIALDQML